MKICILYSGGLDSLIMKRWAEVHYPEAEITAVWYDIGQEYNYKEEAALPPYVEKLKLDWLKDGKELKGKPESISGNIFIPGRNLVLAVAAACKYLPDKIWLGALLGEIYPKATDKNWQFADKASEILTYVLSPFLSKVEIEYPLASAGLNKLTATKWALDNGVSHEHIINSSSCLSGEKGKCGHCVVCFRRWGIFKQLGLSETYNVDPPYCPQNQRMVYEMLTGDHYDEHRKAEILPALDDEYKSSIKNYGARE